MKVPQWVVENLGRNVELSKPCDGHRPGHRGTLVMIDSGMADGDLAPGDAMPQPYAVVALNEHDNSDLSNVDFDGLRPVPFYSHYPFLR